MIGIRQLMGKDPLPGPTSDAPVEPCADCAAFRGRYHQYIRQRGARSAALIRAEEHEKHALVQRMRLMPE